jgi:hypothetical protein
MRGRSRSTASCADMRREIGDEQVRRDARVETRIRARAGMEGEHGFVAACVRKQASRPRQTAARVLPVRECSLSNIGPHCSM